MGKGKGKKGKRDPRSAANKVPQAAKLHPPRPVSPVKKAKKLLSKEKKEAKYNPPLGADMETIKQLAHDRVMRNLVHAKWPALFKKHMGVVESHIKALDRVMSSMKTQMDQMSKKERMEWELGERGNWRVLCEMMDRARQVLADTKKSAEGILPPERLKDKKGLGVTGTTFEPLGPKLAEKAAALGYTKRGKLGRDPDATSTDSDNDTEMSDSPSSNDNADAAPNGAGFVPLSIGTKVPRFPTVEESGEDKTKTTTNEVKPNPYFMIDTNPTPVVLNGNGVVKTSKKRTKEGDVEEKKSKKAKKEKPSVSEAAEPLPIESEVNFAAVEAELKAEVEAAEAAMAQKAQLAESSEDEVSKKKRRRSSDGQELVEKKRKVKKSKKVDDATAANTNEPSAEEPAANVAGKKRKISETGSGDDAVEKKLKKDKKEKKRKADGDGAEDDHGKKKQKQKTAVE